MHISGRSSQQVFLGLGGNIGDKVGRILEAVERMKEKGIEPLRMSSLYRTPPWGDLDQDEFVNAVVEVVFEGSAQELLRLILETEIEMGRVRTHKWGPRLIDIDMIEFKGEQHDSASLILPHPFYTQRNFVLIPLAELEPFWVPSHQEKPIQELIAQLPAEEICRIERLLV